MEMNMKTTNEIMEKMIEVASTLPVQFIKEQLIKLSDATDDLSDTLFQCYLNTLENKMSDSEYLEFLNSL